MRDKTVFAVLAILVLSASALAGTLANDPNALVWNGQTWQGTASLTNGNLSATVDWVVLNENDWSYNGYTPSSDPNYPGYTSYVYAYQVWCTGSDDVMKTFISMLESNEARAIGTFTVDVGDTSALAPTTIGFEGSPIDTANWRWDGVGGLLTGQHSVGLAYTSVNLPIESFLAMGHVQDGGASASALMATPGNEIPEPMTMALLVLGSVGLLRRRRK